MFIRTDRGSLASLHYLLSEEDYKPFTAFGNVSNHHPRNVSLECLWLQTDRLTE